MTQNDECLRSSLSNNIGDIAGRAFVEVPTGAAIYPGEIFSPPRAWVEASHNLVYWSEKEKGGERH